MDAEKAIEYLEWVKHNNYLNASVKVDVVAACDFAINAIRENEADKELLQKSYDAGWDAGFSFASAEDWRR